MNNPQWYQYILNDLALAVEDDDLNSLNNYYTILESLTKRSAECFKLVEDALPIDNARKSILVSIHHAKQSKTSNKKGSR